MWLGAAGIARLSGEYCRVHVEKGCLLVTNMSTYIKNTRPISWIKAARKDFEKFPNNVQDDALSALTIAAEGGKSDNAKPFKGIDGGVLEIVLKHRGDAYRVVYAVKIGEDIWVIHAFQKKSKTGIKTPQMDVDLIRDRLHKLKEVLQ
jgi:phage-related protein